MPSNERTSKAIATDAARIMNMDDTEIMTLALQDPGKIRSLAASLLTQAPDKPKRRDVD